MLVFKNEKQQGKVAQQGLDLGSCDELGNHLRMVVAVRTEGH